MKSVGRIVSRGGIAGLFVPFMGGLPEGIYEVREILGELTIVRIGEQHMPSARFTGLDLSGVFAELVSACMTKEELISCGQLPSEEAGQDGKE